MSASFDILEDGFGSGFPPSRTNQRPRNPRTNSDASERPKVELSAFKQRSSLFQPYGNGRFFGRQIYRSSVLAYLDTEGSWEEDRLSEFIFLRCSSPSSSLSHLTSKIAHFRFGIGINDRNASSRIEYLAVKKLDALRTLVYCFTPSFDASSPVPSSLFSSPSIPEFSPDHI